MKKKKKAEDYIFWFLVVFPQCAILLTQCHLQCSSMFPPSRPYRVDFPPTAAALWEGFHICIISRINKKNKITNFYISRVYNEKVTS